MLIRDLGAARNQTLESRALAGSLSKGWTCLYCNCRDQCRINSSISLYMYVDVRTSRAAITGVWDKEGRDMLPEGEDLERAQKLGDGGVMLQQYCIKYRLHCLRGIAVWRDTRGRLKSFEPAPPLRSLVPDWFGFVSFNHASHSAWSISVMVWCRAQLRV